MTTIHLVYPHGPRISCPDAIGRNLGKGLEQRYRVLHYDWFEPHTIQPGPNDVLLGHGHPFPWTCFRRSLRQPGWKRIIAIQPYAHGDPFQVAFVDSYIEKCDLFLAITGNYWFQSVVESLFAHWLPKMVHLDLAVERRDFPAIKNQFNPPGKRRFVYIGSSVWFKNLDYLGEVAGHMPDTEFAWVGGGTGRIPHVRSLGFQDFVTEPAQKLISSFDFLITLGNADANPTTILEAMAWGLIPVCTPQSGYVDYPGIITVPLADASAAIEQLRRLQSMPEPELKSMQTVNWSLLDSHFNWDRFAVQVSEAIESDARPSVLPVSRARRLYIRSRAMLSPHSPWRPANMARWMRKIARHKPAQRDASTGNLSSAGLEK